MDPVSTVERDFIFIAAKEGIRVDGRNLTEYRDVSIDLSRTDTQSSSIVSIGDTKVCAITNCEIVTGYSDHPNEGLFTIHVNVNPMGGREYTTDLADDVRFELQRVLERSLKDNNTVDVESLCIIPGEKVFSVHCYINIIDNNGNIFDAAVLAATSSLCYFRRPDYSINGTEIRIYAPSEHEPVPLCLHYQPISISFCLLDSELVLLDPNEREEAIKEGMISLVLNAFGELCGVHFLGGIPVDESLLLRCGQIASMKANDLSAILKKALEKSSSQ